MASKRAGMFARLVAGFLLAAVVVAAAPASYVYARQEWSQQSDDSDRQSPNPAETPWYFRKYPLAILEWGESPQGPVLNMAWVWAFAYSGPGLGTAGDYGRWGDTLSYVKMLPEEPAQNLVPGAAAYPVPGTNLQWVELWGLPGLPEEPAILGPGTVVGPVAGGEAVLRTNPALIYDALVPASPDQVPEGIGPRLAERLKEAGLKSFAGQDGTKYFLVESSVNPALALYGYHRMDYQLKLNVPPYRKHVLTLTADELGAVAGTDINENYRFAATVPPNDPAAPWDPPVKSRPQGKGFYRAPQSWHPSLADGLWWKVPGGVLALYLQPPEWSIRAEQEQVSGKPGETVELKLTVTNEWDKENTASLTWRWEGEKERRVVPGYEEVALGPGGSLTFPLAVEVPSESRRVDVFVNMPKPGEKPSLKQIEALWENNVARTLVEPEQLDLEMLSLSGPASPVEPGNNLYSLTALIRNNSPVPVEAYAAIYDSLFPEAVVADLSGTFAPGEIKTLTAEFPGMAGKTYVFRAVVDPLNAIAETDESNNVKTFTVTVDKLPGVEPVDEKKEVRLFE